MLFKQSETTAARRRVPIKMVDATDGFTEEPSLTLSIQVSKNGGTWAAGAGTVSEIGGAGNGLGGYYYEATAAELDTFGSFEVRATATGARTFYGLGQVVSWDPYATINTMRVRQVSASGSNTALTFLTTLTEATDDHWRNALVTFIGGALDGQVRKVSGYNGTTKFITVSEAFTGAPAASDSFVMINA